MFPDRSSPHQVYSGVNAGFSSLMGCVGKSEINDDQMKNRIALQVVDGIVVGARDYRRSDIHGGQLLEEIPVIVDRTLLVFHDKRLNVAWVTHDVTSGKVS